MTEHFVPLDADLAARYAPQLMLDTSEPYRPYAFGYTLFRAPGQSPSSKFVIERAGALTIEYAVYYDWDIGHLYDLEHVWVHIDTSGAVIKVEASSHGGRKPMETGEGLPALAGSRPIIYVEAGKHAHWASPDHMTTADHQKLAFLCSTLAGIEGVRRALSDWLDWMGLVDAGAQARLDRFIGYYEPYATSHEALDRDTGFQEEVRNVARAVAIAVGQLRAGRLSEADRSLKSPRLK